MLDFILSVFPFTGITGAGQFVRDQGIASWVGWTQLALLIGQIGVLAMLRMAIVEKTQLILSKEVFDDFTTQYLAAAAILLLLLGAFFYIYGVWRTFPSNL